MSLQALAQEKFWANKAECEDAEKAYYMRLSGAKVSFSSFTYWLFEYFVQILTCGILMCVFKRSRF